jgi:hypothetical protein
MRKGGMPIARTVGDWAGAERGTVALAEELAGVGELAHQGKGLGNAAAVRGARSTLRKRIVGEANGRPTWSGQHLAAQGTTQKAPDKRVLTPFPQNGVRARKRFRKARMNSQESCRLARSFSARLLPYKHRRSLISLSGSSAKMLNGLGCRSLRPRLVSPALEPELS